MVTQGPRRAGELVFFSYATLTHDSVRRGNNPNSRIQSPSLSLQFTHFQIVTYRCEVRTQDSLDLTWMLRIGSAL